MPPHPLVVVGASAGGLEALLKVVAQLSSPFPAAVLVAMHTRSDGSGMLPLILARRTALPVTFALDGEAIKPGHIYVAPPDYHLIVDPRGLRVLHGPRERGFDPPSIRCSARPPTRSGRGQSA
jgi:two-component system chemotaxis response regulator CheB